MRHNKGRSTVEVKCRCGLVSPAPMTIACRYCGEPVVIHSTQARRMLALVQQMEADEGDAGGLPGDADRLPIPLRRQRLAEVEVLLKRLVEFYRSPDGGDELVLIRRSEMMSDN